MSMNSSEFLKAAAALQAIEMDGLLMFRPTEAQEGILRRMVAEDCFEVLMAGGNRSGKSVLAAVFFASYMRDMPITCWDGGLIYCRPVSKRGRPVNAWVVGDHLKHIGMTIYRLLFEEEPSKGLFKIIKDEVSGAWRAWQPEMFKNDWARKDETKWAPPIIPSSEFKMAPTWATGRKKENEFRKIKLKNNSTVYAFSSSGEVKQGDPVDLVWNDEDIHSANKDYYDEWLARLRDDEGMLVWSTIPRDSCWVFAGVSERAALQSREVSNGERLAKDQHTIHVTMSYLDNPFIPDRQKDLALEQSGDRATLVRIYGELSTQLIRIYQDYSRDYHIAVFSDESRNDRVSDAIRANNYQPPADWTRELILDPGTQKPAILLCAVPPPGYWDHGEPYYIVYREIFIRRALPEQLAEEVMRTERNYRFERFIIDGRMGRQKPPGFAISVEEAYATKFREKKLVSYQTGSGFVAGDDNFERRSKSVISAMRTRPCGRPQLRIVNQACPELVKQLQTNVRKTSPEGEALEVPADNQVDDLRVCLEYWISRRPTYKNRSHDPTPDLSDAHLALERLRKEQREFTARQPQSSNQIMIGSP